MRRALLILLVAVAAAAATATASASPAGPFEGAWGGHGRSLDINGHGVAKEVIYSGCCDHALTMYLKLSRVGGGAKHGHARVRVTRIAHLNADDYSDDYPPPHVGQKGRLRLHAGVVKESISGTNYCNRKAGMRGDCGA